MPQSSPYAALADLSVAFAPPPVSALTDAELLADKQLLADIRRRLDAADASIAAEIAHRSRPELGHSGLAQRMGSRTPEKLIQHLTGVSAKDARTQVSVGSMLVDLAPERASSDTAAPWLRDVAAAVAAGTLTLAAADVIRTGLGTPTGDVTVAALADAAHSLIALADEITVEKLAIRAREVRAAIDDAFGLEHEKAVHERRYLRINRRPDGSLRVEWGLDLEASAEFEAQYNAVTNARLGGPRFVDPDAAAAADAVSRDPRTLEQFAHDMFLELLRLGALADTATFVGARRPAAQIVVTLADLESGTGAAFFEGQGEPVSVATAQRTMCESGGVPILFGDSGEVLNLGREFRLFSRGQRVTLAARDGGCVWPGCDRPPSWCEAHHINEWARDHGKTDVADGVLLCRHHHMLLHNNGWRIVRDDCRYLLIPPSEVDPQQVPIELNASSPAARRARERQRSVLVSA
ncbi:DUF222 domain-containing protein [Schumannella luteola]